MRYFVRIQYNGTPFNGWQKQPNIKSTVQEHIETAMSAVFRSNIAIVGCGRTDTGVHARDFYFHFDTPINYVGNVEKDLNSVARMMSDAVAILSWSRVHDEAHARFDAVSRSYEYVVTTRKNVFSTPLSYHYCFREPINLATLNDAASILSEYLDFTSFCKSNTDVVHKICEIRESYWYKYDEDTYVFRITANRFLRGMIRLVVGMCLNVNRGKIGISQAKSAMQRREILPIQWSVPAHGLYLTEIVYPFLNKEGNYIGFSKQNAH